MIYIIYCLIFIITKPHLTLINSDIGREGRCIDGIKAFQTEKLTFKACRIIYQAKSDY